MQFDCAFCGTTVDKPSGCVNRARKLGNPLYCSRTCFGLGRRKHKTSAQKVAEKAEYDRQYRAKNREMLKAKKAAAYAANPNRERERAYRKANMARHIEYCRRPEYRQYKREYDQIYRAKQDYGEFWEASIIAIQIDAEVKERATRYEIYMERGTINKTMQRKREYGKAVGC